MGQHSDKTVSGPAPSSGQFVLWFLLLAVIITLFWYNYALIVSPMSEMVGDQAMIGAISVANVGAAVIIILELFMGLFFLETLRVTTFFPVIHMLKAPARKSLQIYTIFMLFMFALVQSGLILMRDILVTQEGALTHYRTAGQMTIAAQMTIAFISPFVLILAGLSADRVVRILRGQLT